MRVNIEKKAETKGLIFKETFHVVYVKVEFSEEEALIIKKHKLQNTVVLERPPSADTKGDEEENNLMIYDLFEPKPDRHAFTTPLDAQAYEDELQEALPRLKAYIMANADESPRSSTFEL